MTLVLGQKMRDRVSGFEGIAEIRAEFMTGNVQFTLTSPATKDKESRSKAFDVFQLEAVKTVAAKKEAITPIEAPEVTGVVLGEKVKEIVTGVEGVATIKSTFLNGCIYYTVVPEYKTGQKEYEEFFFEYKRLKRVSAGVTATIAARTTPNEKPTGGPSYNVPSRS